MPLSNSVLRRYTPPTCTLEVAAKSSPLSRWAGKSITKDLRFELRFDDPRQPEEQRVTIRGNAQDLEMLSDAVNSYIQQFLASSSAQLSLNQGSATNGNAAPDHQANGNPNAHFLPIVNQSPQTTPQSPDGSRIELTSSANSPQSFQRRTTLDIFLQAKGLLSHELFLGQLATAESGQSVDLSVSQLFDLATALDEYAAEITALPKQNNALSWKKAPPAWTSAAAMVLVTVGVTGGIAYFNQSNKPQTTALKTGQPTPLLTPLSPLPVPAPVVISPLPTPVVPPTLATVPKLPPPGPVSSPSLGQTTVPPGVTAPNAPVKTSPIAPGAIAILPRRPTIPNSSGTSVQPAPAFSPRNGANSAAVSPPPTQVPRPSAPIAPPPLNGLPSLKPSPSPGAASTDQVASNSRSAGAAADQNPSESAQANKPANSKLADAIPQVAEARSYLQQRWKPPTNLTQNLEYYLLLNSDGSIKRIEPLGNAAARSIDITGIPVPGDAFVSGVTGGGNPKIRAVFNKDGTVATFLEQSN
jgi:Domain of unknown function (DUF4335)